MAVLKNKDLTAKVAKFFAKNAKKIFLSQYFAFFNVKSFYEFLEVP
jgi:hypothetical protein